MASISPTSIACANQPHVSNKPCHITLTITSISDSDATTNERYIGWKLTIDGTAWVTLYAHYASLGGQVLANSTSSISNWKNGHQISSGVNTFSNDNAGNLTLYAYVKQLFYYGYTDARWNTVPGKAQEAGVDMVCSQLPRYANFTSYYVSDSSINTISVHWEVDASCDYAQYSINDGNWIDGAYWPNYSIGGLSPGTQYNIRTRVRRTDSQLWTTSGYIYGTTKSLPTSNTPDDFYLSNNVSPSISSMNYLSYWYVNVYDGNTKIKESGNITSASTVLDMTDSTMISNMLARHPNDNEWTLRFEYFVVSNGVTYQLDSRNCKCKIPSGSYLPIFNDNNVSYVVTDSQSNNITGSNKKVIKGISDVQVTCTPASPQGSSSISSYSATSGTVSNSISNTSPIVINLTDVNGSSLSVQAIDSRGRSTVVSKNYDTFIDYFSPVIDSATIVRENGVGTNILVTLNGRYCNWTGLATTNVMEQTSLQYKLKGDANYTTISGVNLTITNNNGNFTVSGIITGDLFSVSSEYDLLLTFSDKISTIANLTSIHTGKALIWKDLLNKRIGIGKKPDVTLDVDGNTNISGNLKVDGNVKATDGLMFGNYILHPSDMAALSAGSGAHINVDKCYIFQVDWNDYQSYDWRFAGALGLVFTLGESNSSSLVLMLFHYDGTIVGLNIFVDRIRWTGWHWLTLS